MNKLLILCALSLTLAASTADTNAPAATPQTTNAPAATPQTPPAQPPITGPELSELTTLARFAATGQLRDTWRAYQRLLDLCDKLDRALATK